MKSLASSGVTVPAIPALLGYAGLLPFVGLSVGLWIVPEAYEQVLHAALLGYASIILAFMGAVHWGLAMQDSGPIAGRQFVWSVMPALIAWFASVFSPMTRYSVLTVAFAALCLLDGRMIKLGKAPAWYLKLRAPLTAVVVLSLITAQISLLR